ncbi:MAG: bifunctional phosphoglucose/phosphomannose isomerase [Dehalococcoidia bacterium]
MPESSLDGPELYARIDPEGLRDRIAGLPAQIDEAWTAASALELPTDYRSAERIVVLGMGGSGIGGSLLRALALDIGAKTPVTVVRGYRLPAWVDSRTLVLASSNSGNTEEIVASFEQAIAAGAKCIVLASGGRMLEIAASSDVPALNVRWDGEPRAALGWSYVSLLAICRRLGLLPDQTDDLRVALVELRAYAGQLGIDVPEASNAAKQLARRWYGKLIAIVGAEALAPVAYRWRTQINENAKSWAIADELPEMNHNAALGFGAPAALVPMLHVVLLRHAAMHPRIRLRVDATLDELRMNAVAAEVIDVPGASVLAQQLCAVHLGDWASYYLGVLNGVNPSSMDALERLKDLLASKR